METVGGHRPPLQWTVFNRRPPGNSRLKFFARPACRYASDLSPSASSHNTHLCDRNLKQGLGRGAALRQVQLEILKRNPQLHPFYWANFIQSGDWTALDTNR
jgi:hypothetical protein